MLVFERWVCYIILVIRLCTTAASAAPAATAAAAPPAAPAASAKASSTSAGSGKAATAAASTPSATPTTTAATAAPVAIVVDASDDWTKEQVVCTFLMPLFFFLFLVRNNHDVHVDADKHPHSSTVGLWFAVVCSCAQQALQTALAKHPSTLERAERWKLIAADVPGKSMKDCVAKFKALREAVLKQSK